MTAYVTEKNNDDAEHEHDAALLSLSNYIYNNRSGAIQSPSYRALLVAIKKIDPEDTFLKITDKFRGIAARSPALSSVNSVIKNQLSTLIKDLKYRPEIAKDSLAITSPKMSVSFEFENIEQGLVSKQKSFSSEDLRRSSDTDHTDDESVESNSDTSSEMEAIFQANEKIVHKNLRDVVTPSKDTQHRAIRLLIRYIQAYNATPAADRSSESKYIITQVKVLCPGLLSKITPNVEPDFIEKLKKSDRDNLYVIAGASRKELNAFYDQTSLVAQRDSSSLKK